MSAPEQPMTEGITPTVNPLPKEGGEETVTIPKSQYQELINSNLNSITNTLNTLDNLDKIIASLNNMQSFVMNLKEGVKTTQLGMNKPTQPPATIEQ